MTSNSMDRSALFFSAAVLVVLLVLGACGPRVQAQARIPRNPAPTARSATPTPTPAVVEAVTVRPAVAPTPWRPCETNRYRSPRNCYDDRRVQQSADRTRVR